jgi:hypothetical protein
MVVGVDQVSGAASAPAGASASIAASMIATNSPNLALPRPTPVNSPPAKPLAKQRRRPPAAHHACRDAPCLI